MKELSRKCQYFTDSVIRRMTRIAIANNAINLAQGFPDYNPPKAMLDRMAEVAYEGPHQYAITMGAKNFRDALAAKCGRWMGRTIDPEKEVVVTVGATEAMVDSIFALTNPGDKIVIFSPYFENYQAQNERQFSELRGEIRVLSTRMDGLDNRMADLQNLISWSFTLSAAFIAVIGIIISVFIAFAPSIWSFVRRKRQPDLSREDVKSLVAEQVSEALKHYFTARTDVQGK